MNLRPLVSIVDDDESVRESLPDLLREFGYTVRAFSSAEEFLMTGLIETRCLVLDVAMPGMSGPELLMEMKRRHLKIPVIFITAQTDENLRSRVLELGAIECLTKPFSDEAMRSAVAAAVHGP